MKVSRSGFDWSDVEFRFCAFDGHFYGYGPTPSAASKMYEEVANAMRANERK